MPNNVIIVPQQSAPPTANEKLIPVSTDNGDSCAPTTPSTNTQQHNDLLGIQGGDALNRWHLDENSYDAVTNATNASSDNTFVTQSELEANSAKLKEPITANLGGGNTIGGINDGDTFDTTHSAEDILRKMLSKAVPHVYVQPHFTSFTSNYSSGVVECGEIRSITYTSTYLNGDAGTLGFYSLYRGSTVVSNINPYTDANLAFANTPITYYATQAYGEGPVINDNTGVPSPGHIMSGVATSGSITVTPKRRSFFNYLTNTTIPNTSDGVRGLGQSAYSGPVYIDQNTFVISISAGAKSVIFAVPSTKTLVSVIFNIGITSDETATFVANKSSLNVAGANTYTPISYDLYYYTPIGSFTSPCTYTVTIA